jgi:hypothetical protein
MPDVHAHGRARPEILEDTVQSDDIVIHLIIIKKLYFMWIISSTYKCLT